MRGSIRLIHFDDWLEKWSTPDWVSTLRELDGIDLLRLSSDAPRGETSGALAAAHAYQISPRVEMRANWVLADRSLLERMPELLAVCTTGSGYDVVDVPACTEAGIIVCNQAGSNKEAVAEHALGMILALSKKIAFADKLLRRGGHIDRLALEGSDIRGKTLGIIGIGHIGTRLAELCSGVFAMKVLACDPYLSADEIAVRHAAKVTMEEIFRRSDFVSVHCPRTDETMGMIGAEQFRLMKPSAYFVTTARGGVHRETDLAEALAEKRLAGAGIDVFIEEPPPPDHPLLAFDNVIATPHMAGTTRESIVNMALGNAQQWLEIFRGAVPSRLINPEAWPKYARRFEAAFGFAPRQLRGASIGAPEHAALP